MRVLQEFGKLYQGARARRRRNDFVVISMEIISLFRVLSAYVVSNLQTGVSHLDGYLAGTEFGQNDSTRYWLIHGAIGVTGIAMYFVSVEMFKYLAGLFWLVASGGAMAIHSGFIPGSE